MSHSFSICQQCQGLNKISIEKAKNKQAVCGKCGAGLPLHGLVSEVDSTGLNRILKASDRPVIVDFWASWCGPCQVYGPEFEKASLTTPQAVFLKVNTEAEQTLSSQLGIRGIPCTIVFKGGKEYRRQAGAMDVNGIQALLN